MSLFEILWNKKVTVVIRCQLGSDVAPHMGFGYYACMSEVGFIFGLVSGLLLKILKIFSSLTPIVGSFVCSTWNFLVFTWNLSILVNFRKFLFLKKMTFSDSWLKVTYVYVVFLRKKIFTKINIFLILHSKFFYMKLHLKISRDAQLQTPNNIIATPPTFLRATTL